MLRRHRRDISRWLILALGLVSLFIAVRGLAIGEVPARHGTFYLSEDEPNFAAGLMFYFIVSIGCCIAFWWMREKGNDLY